MVKPIVNYHTVFLTFSNSGRKILTVLRLSRIYNVVQRKS